MQPGLNLLEETLEHFTMGAKSVTAYSNSHTYIIRRDVNAIDQYIVIEEEAGFSKTKTVSLDTYFAEVFGIDAKY